MRGGGLLGRGQEVQEGAPPHPVGHQSNWERKTQIPVVTTGAAGSDGFLSTGIQQSGAVKKDDKRSQQLKARQVRRWRLDEVAAPRQEVHFPPDPVAPSPSNLDPELRRESNHQQRLLPNGEFNGDVGGGGSRTQITLFMLEAAAEKIPPANRGRRRGLAVR